MVTSSPPGNALPSSHNSNTMTTQPSSQEGAHELMPDLPEDSN